MLPINSVTEHISQKKTQQDGGSFFLFFHRHKAAPWPFQAIPSLETASQIGRPLGLCAEALYDSAQGLGLTATTLNYLYLAGLDNPASWEGLGDLRMWFYWDLVDYPPNAAVLAHDPPEAEVPAYSLSEAAVPANDPPEATVPTHKAPEAVVSAYSSPEIAVPAHETPKAAVPAHKAPEAAVPAYSSPEIAVPAHETPEAVVPAHDTPEAAVALTMFPRWRPSLNSLTVWSQPRLPISQLFYIFILNPPGLSHPLPPWLSTIGGQHRRELPWCNPPARPWSSAKIPEPPDPPWFNTLFPPWPVSPDLSLTGFPPPSLPLPMLRCVRFCILFVCIVFSFSLQSICCL